MRKFINFILILSFTASCVYARQLPNLGDYSSSVLSPTQEYAMGLAFMRQLRKQTPIITDPLLNNYIAALGSKLVTTSQDHQTNFHFFIVKQPTINAFSAPGGFVGVNAGLFLATQNESQLASVLAHEITHVTQHHIARAIVKQKSLTLPNIGAMLAAILVGTQAGGDAGIGTVAAVQGGTMQHMLSFMRSSEQEADRIGMKLLHNAGFDPHAMPKFLEHMQQKEMDYGKDIMLYLRTHPFTSSRIAETKDRAIQLPKAKPISNFEFYLMRARLRVILSKNGITAKKYFHHCIKNNSCVNYEAAQYGYALALAKNHNNQQALNLILQLNKQDPYQFIYQFSLAEIYASAHNYPKALAQLKNNLEIYPDSYPLIMQYANTLFLAGKYRETAAFINKQLKNYPNDLHLYALLAKAEAKNGNLAAAYYARAATFALAGDLEMALIQLNQSLKQPDLKPHHKLIIQSHKQQLQKYLHPKS